MKRNILEFNIQTKAEKAANDMIDFLVKVELHPEYINWHGMQALSMNNIPFPQREAREYSKLYVHKHIKVKLYDRCWQNIKAPFLIIQSIREWFRYGCP